jgi:hypothetical protein
MNLDYDETRALPMTRVIWTITADHTVDVPTHEWDSMGEDERDAYLAAAETMGSGRVVITREITSAENGY